MTLEQTRVNDEVWLPRRLTFKFDARVALFKGYNIDGDQAYRDYKKFRTTSKIVGMGEVKEVWREPVRRSNKYQEVTCCIFH